MTQAREQPERYRVVRRQPIVDAIHEAIEASGGKVLRRADHRSAPFELQVEAPEGEKLELVCYAFLANKYGQGARPADEHRFQIKYGSDFQRYHQVFLDPTRRRVTLMLGVHLERRLFIAVDPAMHAPTWFSSSVEFKTAELEETQRKGWHGWERERSDVRRKIARPFESNETEVLLGLTPDRFLDYVQLERIATGLDAGQRLLLIDKTQEAQRPDSLVHPLERVFGMSAHTILDLIWQRFRLATAVRGGVAEHHLGNLLRGVEGVSKVERLDADGQPDFHFAYVGRAYTLECKNVLRKPMGPHPRVDFQKTRASKGDPCSRYYKQGAFDILAACLQPITEKWEYRFCFTSMLPPHRSCEGRLSQRVIVSGPGWTEDLRALLDAGG